MRFPSGRASAKRIKSIKLKQGRGRKNGGATCTKDLLLLPLLLENCTGPAWPSPRQAWPRPVQARPAWHAFNEISYTFMERNGTENHGTVFSWNGTERICLEQFYSWNGTERHGTVSAMSSWNGTTFLERNAFSRRNGTDGNGTDRLVKRNTLSGTERMPVAISQWSGQRKAH